MNQLKHNIVNAILYLICLGIGEYFVSKIFSFQIIVLVIASFTYSFLLSTVFTRNFLIINGWDEESAID